MIIKMLFAVVGAAALIDGTLGGLTANFNLGFAVEILCGIVCIAVGIFWGKFKKQLKIATIVIFAAVFALCAAIGIYGAHDTATYNEDVLIVLGAGVNGETPTRVLANRLEKAVEYLNKNQDAYVIVTGGQGPQEDITEAAAMEKYLVESGISDERIIKEEKATSTSENYEYSKEIIDEFFPGGSIVTITNDFHIYRAKKLARVAGIETTTLHASTPKSGRAAMYLREILAVMKVTVFGH